MSTILDLFQFFFRTSSNFRKSNRNAACKVDDYGMVMEKTSRQKNNQK